MAKADKKKKKASWHEIGDDGWKRSKEEEAASKLRREQKGPRRFWLESDSSAKITFLDTPKFFFHEHNLKLGGKYFNFFTCLRESDTCPPCEDGDRPGYVVVSTVISHREWTDRENKLHKNEKMLFIAKGRAKQRLEKQIERREGDLRGCVYEMARGSGATECSTGEDFEYLKRLSNSALEKFIPKGEDKTWLEPFDYEEIFAPMDPEDIRKIIGGSSPIGSGKESSEEDEDEDEKPKKSKKKKRDEDEEEEEKPKKSSKKKKKDEDEDEDEDEDDLDIDSLL